MTSVRNETCLSVRPETLTHLEQPCDHLFRTRRAVPPSIFELNVTLLNGQVDAERHLVHHQLVLLAHFTLPPSNTFSSLAKRRHVWSQLAVICPVIHAQQLTLSVFISCSAIFGNCL